MYINLTICLNVCVTVCQYAESLSTSQPRANNWYQHFRSDSLLYSPLSSAVQQYYEISSNHPPVLSFSLLSFEALRGEARR